MENPGGWGGVHHRPSGMEIPGGWGGVKTERPSMGGIWIFSGNTHDIKVLYHFEDVPVDPFGHIDLAAKYCVETVHSDYQQDQTDPTVEVPDLSMNPSSLDLHTKYYVIDK